MLTNYDMCYENNSKISIDFFQSPELKPTELNHQKIQRTHYAHGYKYTDIVVWIERVKNRLGREHGRCTPKKSHSLSCKWRRFHAILFRRAIFPPREERPYFFSTLVSWTGLWPLVSRRFQPSSGVTHFRRVYQALAKASCLFFDSDSFRNKSARADRVFRESKGHQIELRGFTPRPWGQ